MTREREDSRRPEQIRFRGLTAEVSRSALLSARGSAWPCCAGRDVIVNGGEGQKDNSSVFEEDLPTPAAPPEPAVLDQIPAHRTQFPGPANCRSPKIAGRNRPNVRLMFLLLPNGFGLIKHNFG